MNVGANGAKRSVLELCKRMKKKEKVQGAKERRCKRRGRADEEYRVIWEKYRLDTSSIKAIWEAVNEEVKETRKYRLDISLIGR